ncbi:MAG: putative glycosyltransferase [Candidatus Taylorbacteria bacterium]|nr:putative glycosyltransferase [Candidatus Taylorbacteria bacterium]
MSNITFIIFARNEEKRISYVIRNLIGYGEVIIFDGGSTDKTKEISEHLGARFVPRPPSDKKYVETQENFDFIKSITKTDWIYWGYADNIAPKTLAEEMVRISLQDKIKHVVIPLYTYLWGNTRNYAHKGGAPMLYHKDFMNYEKNYMHGMGQFTGSSDQKMTLPKKKEYALHHFSTYNIAKFTAGHLSYAEEEAHYKYRSGKKFSSLRMLAAMVRYCWIFRTGLKNPRLGLIIMLSYAFSRFMVYARLYELENGITLESMERNYSAAKEKMLEEFK